MDPSWGSQIHADLPVCCQVWEHHLKRPGVRFERKSEAWNLTFHVKMEITEIALPTSSKIHIFQLLSLKRSRRRLQKLTQNQPLGCFGLGFFVSEAVGSFFVKVKRFHYKNFRHPSKMGVEFRRNITVSQA